MAAIKIHSLHDVARAYLQTLGYQAADLSEETVSFFISALGIPPETAEELVCRADDILYGTALKIFNGITFERRQIVACFKLFFSLLDGAEKCSVKELAKGKIPSELMENIRQHAVMSAPEYHFEAMKPQTIEEAHWFGRFFARLKRGGVK